MGNSPEETEQTTVTDTAYSAYRRKRMTGYTSQSPYHEEESDSGRVDDEGEPHLEEVTRVEPESYMHVNGRKVVMYNWESNQRIKQNRTTGRR